MTKGINTNAFICVHLCLSVASILALGFVGAALRRDSKLICAPAGCRN